MPPVARRAGYLVGEAWRTEEVGWLRWTLRKTRRRDAGRTLRRGDTMLADRLRTGRPQTAGASAAAVRPVASTIRMDRPGAGAGGGRSLEAVTRRRFEAGFGHDFGAVRVHTDPAAEEAARGQGARAFTVGGHIYFARGQYAPHTPEGDRRIAHEL